MTWLYDERVQFAALVTPLVLAVWVYLWAVGCTWRDK